MFNWNRGLMVSGAVLMAATQVKAITLTNFDNFTPLANSAGPIPVGGAGEATPITLGNKSWVQQSIADRATQNTLVPGSNSGNWDMIAANETGPDAGRYLFMPFETGTAGVQRVDLKDPNYNTRTVNIVAPGTQAFVVGDASRWTPWGSYLTAEESWGTNSTKGRLFEVTNPVTATVNGGTFIHRSTVARVSHEGLAFDSSNNLYYIDELNGGSIYKFTSDTPNATSGNDFFAAGTNSVLRVGDGNTPNAVGAYQWIAFADENGVFAGGITTDGSADGRLTTNVAAYKGTDYQRPEDMEIQVINGVELLYIATTTTNEVYALNLLTNEISVFANQSTIDLATGLPVGSGLLSPDNIAIDSENNIYIIEDRNGGVDDDIWFANDINKDGDLLDAGEGIARWASNGTQGSEFTGLYFDRFNPNLAYVNIQHPSSGVDRLLVIDASIPEPATMSLLGFAGLLAIRRSRRRA